MDSAITTGLFTLGGTLAGSLATVRVQRSSNRAAERVRARELLGQIVTAANAQQMEAIAFQLRRNSWRANAVASGAALLEIFAARRDGNWLRGAAAGVRELRTWDMAEAARFQERYGAASAEMGPALLHLSLMSRPLQEAAGQVSDALRAGMTAMNAQDAKSSEERIEATIAKLSDAVRAFTSRR